MGEGLGHEDDMFAIAERLGASLWDDDDLWAFPILTAQENGEGCLKGKEVEVAPAAATKGKKRRASEAGPGDPSGDKRVGEGKGGGGSGGDHEQHIVIERERRKKMRDMFTSLHSLIPHLPPRTDKATVVDEAIQYIVKLQQNLGILEKRKAQTFKGKTYITTTGDNIPPMLAQNNKFSIPSREVFLAEHGSANKAAAVSLPNTNRPPLFSGRPEFPTIFKTWTSPNVILNVFGKDAHINICCPAKPGLLTGICFVLEKYALEAVSAEVSSDGGKYMCMIHARANGVAVGSHFVVEEIFKQAASEIMALPVKLVYMCECGFYTYSIAALLLWETRRKDFSVMMSHHVITVLLIAFSYMTRFFRVGTVILALHDASDVFLEAAKVFKYSGNELGASVFFCLFAVSWVILRLIFFPFWVIRSTSYYLCEVLVLSQPYSATLYYFFNTMLLTLLVFHIYWWILICAMIMRQLKNRGQVGEDIRSDSDDDN